MKTIILILIITIFTIITGCQGCKGRAPYIYVDIFPNPVKREYNVGDTLQFSLRTLEYKNEYINSFGINGDGHLACYDIIFEFETLTKLNVESFINKIDKNVNIYDTIKCYYYIHFTKVSEELVVDIKIPLIDTGLFIIKNMSVLVNPNQNIEKMIYVPNFAGRIILPSNYKPPCDIPDSLLVNAGAHFIVLVKNQTTKCE